MTLLNSMSSLGNSFSGLNSSNSMSIVGGSSSESNQGVNSEACCYRRRRHCNRVYIFGDVNIGRGYGNYGCGGSGYGGYEGY